MRSEREEKTTAGSVLQKPGELDLEEKEGEILIYSQLTGSLLQKGCEESKFALRVWP